MMMRRGNDFDLVLMAIWALWDNFPRLRGISCPLLKIFIQIFALNDDHLLIFDKSERELSGCDTNFWKLVEMIFVFEVKS